MRKRDIGGNDDGAARDPFRDPIIGGTINGVLGTAMALLETT